jgi:hypothetical protein
MSESSHWYDVEGNPRHFVPKKTGPGNRATTIKDAREHGWLPSVTGIINVMAKPQLERWKMLQACSAVLTSPRREGEELDAFMNRVLFEDKEAEQEAKAAAERGTDLHDAISNALQAKGFDPKWKVYVQSILPVIEFMGKVRWIEKVLVGDGYAGRSDILIEGDENLALLDWKSCKTLPKEDSWTEHRLQSSAYAAALGNTGDKRLITGNIYLSTTLPGQTALFLQDDWKKTYEEGFVPLLKLWQFLNDYKGGQP